jgi:hypothetical protein
MHAIITKEIKTQKIKAEKLKIYSNDFKSEWVLNNFSHSLVTLKHILIGRHL